MQKNKNTIQGEYKLQIKKTGKTGPQKEKTGKKYMPYV